MYLLNALGRSRFAGRAAALKKALHRPVVKGGMVGRSGFALNTFWKFA